VAYLNLPSERGWVKLLIVRLRGVMIDNRGESVTSRRGEEQADKPDR
jgi:hypothetical protein